MVAIGTFVLVCLAMAIVAYCEYHNYWLRPGDDSEGGGLQIGGKEDAEALKRLETWTAKYEARHKNVVGLAGKWRAIWHFARFLLFSSQEQKQEQVRRNELTAEKLLLEYQKLVRLPGHERVDRFIRWRDDVADFELRRKGHSNNGEQRDC